MPTVLTPQGNEGFGIRTNVMRECDSIVSVPLCPGVYAEQFVTSGAQCIYVFSIELV